jgi:hypothetical protein
LDADLNASVLEINDNPSFDIYFGKEFMSFKRQYEEDICPVDFYVKSKVLGDAINLARKKKKPDSFKSFSFIAE